MGLITIIPVEETFLRVFEKPKKVRLNKQVIEFNYAHLSPYKNGAHLFYQTDTKIYIWYLAKPVSDNYTVTIPEGYLLYRFFKERPNAVILLPREGYINALVIGKGELCAQVTLQTGADQGHSLDLLKREYSLQNPDMIRLEATARFSVKPADLLAFAHFDLKPAELLEKFIELVKIPIIAALLITAGFTLYESIRLESLYTEKQHYLARLKRENAPLQSSLEQVREQSAYWRNFITKDQAYPDFYQSLSQLTEVIQHHGGYINNVEFADNRLTIWTGMKASEATIIKDLLATGLFQEAKLLASNKDSSRPDFSLYNLTITLRPRQKGEQS